MVFVSKAYVSNFDDQGLANRQLLPIIAESSHCFFYALESICGETKHNSCHSQLSYNVERNIVK